MRIFILSHKLELANMINETLGKQLHDKMSRGETLSAEEREKLDAWYTWMDQEETSTLGLSPLRDSTQSLKAKIESAVAQMVNISNRIQQLVKDNELLRQENQQLKTRLAQLLERKSA